MFAMAVQPSTFSTTSHTAGRLRSDRSSRRRTVEAVAFAGVWVVAGYLLHLSSDAYLLLGIPLTIGFQLLVRRRPLRELFVRNTTQFSLGKRGLAMATGLALVPGYFAARALADRDWTLFGWYLAAIAGAFAAAFALRASSVRAVVRSAALPIAIGAGGMALVYGTMHIATGAPLSAAAAVAAIAKYTALYFPATVLLEEVAFRGALDAHVHVDGERGGWRSAVLVSTLWGLWHLPVSHGLPLPLQVVELVVVHVVLGVPLSFVWRRSHNLAGPALAHAVNDAVRNAFMLGL
jgi:membrane protease YdiL (CAAX protease family)